MTLHDARPRACRLAAVFAVASAVALGACARARHESGESSAEPSALASQLFSADTLLAHQAALGLAADQRAAVATELSRARAELAPLDASLRAERDALAETLRGTRVDEAAAVARATRVTDLEARVKIAHLRLLVRLKNLLTPAQQAQLAALGATARRSPRDAPP